MIYKITKIKKIDFYIKNNSIICIDIDNTLITSFTYIGSEKWENDLIISYQKKGYSKNESIILARKLWQKKQITSRMKLIEKDVSNLLLKWNQNNKIIFLTARSKNIKKITYKQLLSTNIPSFIFNEIVFCSSNSKGIILLNFLNKNPYLFSCSNIIAVDDNKKHLIDIESVLSQYDIPFIGFEYIHKSIL